MEGQIIAGSHYDLADKFITEFYKEKMIDRGLVYANMKQNVAAEYDIENIIHDELDMIWCYNSECGYPAPKQGSAPDEWYFKMLVKYDYDRTDGEYIYDINPEMELERLSEHFGEDLNNDSIDEKAQSYERIHLFEKEQDEVRYFYVKNKDAYKLFLQDLHLAPIVKNKMSQELINIFFISGKIHQRWGRKKSARFV